MTAADLLADLTRQGFTLAPEGGGICVTPASRLTAELREAIGAHKPALLALLGGPERAAATAHKHEQLCGPAGGGSVVISGQTYPYARRWAGAPLTTAGGFLAFDTETEPIPDDPAAPPPRLALASASAGEADSCLIHPDDVGRFVLAHRGLHVVGHNVSFDFWVVEHHLRTRGEEEARLAWWAVADECRLHDSMLLDALVRLARDDTYPRPRGLDVIAEEYAGLEVDKADPYRLRYGEIIGADWGTAEEGYFSYAVKDAIATRLAYAALRRQATALAERYRAEVWPDAGVRFGLLTEAVQVKKAIALAQVTRTGMRVDLDRVRRGEADLRQRLDAAVADVRALGPDLYKLDKGGNLKPTKTGAPSRSNKALVARLAAVKEEVEAANGVTLSVPLTAKKQEPTASTEFWGDHKELHPFLSSWVESEELAKLLQFFSHLRAARVHPRYTVLVRSGRTSCSGPNVQQIPRDGPLRAAFVPSPGHFLLAVDYCYIELRTLAAVCRKRYGQSALADVIRAGIDPHAHTAALMLNVPPEEFAAWKNDPARADAYKKARQAAKPVNFGVPGGLGADSLASYARKSYGVAMTAEEAKERRERLVGKVYPELTDYLAEDVHAVLAGTLHTTVEAVRRALGDIHLTCVRKVLEGDPKRVDGAPYKPAFVGTIWRALAAVNRNPDLVEALHARAPGPGLARKVCQAGVATLTGRVRGRVRYSQARNTPFQGLAADGAALALFALVKGGFRVVGFVHDEVLVELPDEGGYVSEAAVKRVEQVMVAEMEQVLGGLPAGVESTVSTRWSKQAKLIVRDGRAVPWEPEVPAAQPARQAEAPAELPGVAQETSAAGAGPNRRPCRRRSAGGALRRPGGQGPLVRGLLDVGGLPSHPPRRLG
jgi:hypothetical protein